ncbi:MAG: bifunctional serine/threonine-protein kinase/universal stress protein [Thermodesulfovibrionia bacterium]|nr:bifunctional serine/threonine-protein kinase/universal stress protein [Thermodesulfovibrionia bacterium]
MAEEPIKTGTLLGGFTIQEKIHAGGMATIWKVTREDMALPMVMKVPWLKDGDDPSFVVSFEVEQMIMPKLTGKHVPRFIAAGDFTNRPFLVMEHIPGSSLDTRMDKAPFHADEVAGIGAKVAAALHDLHRQHVIHLDVTPDNILLCESGEAVLIDFGLSRHENLPDLMAEEFRLPIGTAPYISPEQVLNIRSDPRSDIFSLGVILYQLITGEQPFGDPKSGAGLRRRLYVDPVPPRALNKECPRWLQEIILKCLEVDPAARYGSAAQLAFALQHPEQVELTSRAERGRRDSHWTIFKRWFNYKKYGLSFTRSVTRHLDAVPIIMAAVDTSARAEALSVTLRQAVQRIFYAGRNARLTCVTVRKTPLVGIDLGVDEAGRNLHVKSLIELKHWARGLEIPADRISFHVLEFPDPAAALVNYAASNHVDHIIIGARGSSAMRRFLGSVSSRVVAEAPCSVTVVRHHKNEDAFQGDELENQEEKN